MLGRPRIQWRGLEEICGTVAHTLFIHPERLTVGPIIAARVAPDELLDPRGDARCGSDKYTDGLQSSLEACACPLMIKLASELADSTELYRCADMPGSDHGGARASPSKEIPITTGTATLCPSTCRCVHQHGHAGRERDTCAAIG